LIKGFEMNDFTFDWEGKGIKVDKKEVPPEYEMPTNNEHTPCEGPDAQCNMFCRDFLKRCHP
jgi:hypothetical protein